MPPKRTFTVIFVKKPKMKRAAVPCSRRKEFIDKLLARFSRLPGRGSSSAHGVGRGNSEPQMGSPSAEHGAAEPKVLRLLCLFSAGLDMHPTSSEVS